MAVDFRIRDFSHPLAIYRLKRRFDRNQWMPRASLEADQWIRLKSILERCFQKVPYYRRLWETLDLTPTDIVTPEDLKRLPILSREDLSDSIGDLMATDARRFGPIADTTSGTTGTPTRFYLARSSNVLEFVYYWRHWGWAGYRLGDRFAELGAYYFLKRTSIIDRTALWQPVLQRLMLNSTRLSRSRAKEMAVAIRLRRPLFLKGTASALYFFALSLQDAGIDDIGFTAIFSTGEVLTPALRSRISEVFHGPVLDSYGHMERTVAISECPDGGYHVNSDYGWVEFTDPQPSDNGTSLRARIVATSLHNMAMPLVRYDTGDDIELFTETRPCSCGRTFPLIKALHGRREDAIVTPDGSFITAMYVVPELIVGARFIQFIQESADMLAVHVVPASGWTDTEQSLLEERVRSLVGKGMALRIHMIGEKDLVRDISGKIRTVISKTRVSR